MPRFISVRLLLGLIVIAADVAALSAKTTVFVIASDFYAPLNWRELYKTIEIKGVTKLDDEEAFIVVKTSNDGMPVTDYISTKSYLLLRRNTLRGIMRYGYYREVDGVMMPFKWTIESSGTGEQIITGKTLKFDVPLSDVLFTAETRSSRRDSPRNDQNLGEILRNFTQSYECCY